jgi:site-specific recombinase
MQTSATIENRESISLIVDRLVPREGEIDRYLVTRTREEYDVLLKAALGGHVPSRIALRRSGLWLERQRIVPPDSVLFQ